MNTLSDYFPVWDKLDAAQRGRLENSATWRAAQRGETLHYGSAGCEGLFVVKSGQLRGYILSQEGKEVTLYRLFEGDICLFSAACMLSGIQFDIVIEAEKATGLWIIPVNVFQELMQNNLAVANYTNQLMAARFSDVMWLMDQILFKSVDVRLATFLLNESGIEGGDRLAITHERIAAHMGTAREVVTRMLKYFQAEGMVALSRGAIELTDREKLGKIGN